MKKISLLFTVIAVLALVIVGACGGDAGEEETTATTTAATTTTTTSTTTAPQTTQPSNGGDGGLSWNDMPIYPGADQIQKGSWSIPAEEGEYSKVEWRYYETGDDLDDVVDFYKDKMPDNGWEEMGWFDMQEMAWGLYVKNNEKDAAYVWMMEEEGQTVVALMRGAE